MKYLLFSSIGDNYDAFDSWYCKRKKRNYDIKLVYYGDDDNRYEKLKKYSDDIIINKGSKYQNLRDYYDYFDIIEYDYVWIPDDDIRLESKNIDNMFNLVSKKRIKISQPSMDPNGYNSWKINTNKYGIKKDIIIYTTFVEVTCPILSNNVVKKTVEILKMYRNLTAWGIDYIWQNYFECKFGILYNVMVYNPHPYEKKNKRRECEKMGSREERMNEWLKVKSELNLEEKKKYELYIENIKSGRKLVA